MRYYEGHISKRVGRIRRDVKDMKLFYEGELMDLPDGELRTKKNKGRTY